MTDSDSKTYMRKSEAIGIDRKLLEILVCPATKKALQFDAEAGELISAAARLAYPVRDGVPIMLPEEARELSDEEAAHWDRGG
ncbi:MAG: hypothetical protein Tsb0010_18820 [Parvularculaceae bacterium]